MSSAFLASVKTVLTGKSFICSYLCIISLCANAQNVGIGINSNIAARLHVAKPDSGLLILDNTSAYLDSAKSRLYFRTGGWYTGAIGTHIESGSGHTSRLGLYTYSFTDANSLKERLSITDEGNVGIGTVAPTALLQVTGNSSSQTTGYFENPFINSTGPVMSVVGNSISGIGQQSILAKIKGASSGNTNIALAGLVTEDVNANGVGVFGQATEGIGVKGFTFNGIGIEGRSTNPGGIAANLFAPTGTALKTNGKIQLTGISEGAGKVLTSDVGGNAMWTTLIRNDVTCINGVSFQPAESNDAVWRASSAGGIFFLPAPGNTYLIAPVNLPQGSTITSIAIWFKDNSSNDITFTFEQQSLAGGSAYTTLSTSETFGASLNWRSIPINQAVIPTIDNSTNTYYIRATANWPSGSDMAIKGAVINYSYKLN